jgi:hypothetical protein
MALVTLHTAMADRAGLPIRLQTRHSPPPVVVASPSWIGASWLSRLASWRFAVGEREGEVDAFEFPDPAFRLSSGPAGVEVGFDLVEAADHLGVDAQHRAADAGVLVLARCGVGSAAVAEFDFAFVEVSLELGPLVGGGGPVLGGPGASAGGERGAPGNGGRRLR